MKTNQTTMTSPPRPVGVSAWRVVSEAWAAGIAPPLAISPSDWGRRNLRVPDGPRAGQMWDPVLTPQLVEIIDHLAIDSPVNQVVLRKSAQLGYTQVGQVWLGYIVDVAPAKTLMVLPTLSLAQDFNREKLAESIRISPALRAKVRRQTGRSSEGSTALNKRFPGGSIIITGANSTADLRSKTARYAFGDEIDDWPLDLDGQGDPQQMLEARQMAFLATGDWKRFYGSTPTVKGGSRIDTLFEGGDQRYWHVRCPHCGAEQRLNFFPDHNGAGGLRFNREYPYQAYYACLNGCVIEHHHKRGMVLSGRWIATAPGPGRYPSYHLDTLSSLLVPWDAIAEEFCESKKDASKLKTFWNLWLGLPWEDRGEAPDWEKIMVRREDYPPARVPVGALVLTAGCDVQQDGIYYEVVGWGPDKQSWSIDCGFLRGATADPDNPVWRELDIIYQRRYPDAHGGAWPVDAFAVDSGYNTNQVYLWTSARPKAFAVKGTDGWSHAAIASTPTKQQITWAGKRERRGASLWAVGTWALKAELYANLRKDGPRDGEEGFPLGYCHFGPHNDEAYFRQLTAEHLAERTVNGRPSHWWKASGPNHYLDCRVYAMALAYHLGIDKLTADDWARLRSERGATAPQQGDLLAVTVARPPEPAPAPASPPPAPAVNPSGRKPWISKRSR